MELPFVQVDAFTSEPFRGNSAAIVFVPADDPRLGDDAWLQAVAAEMNLAETAYLSPRDDGSFNLRWFTPTVEVDLCGHATLASAWAIWTEPGAPQTELLQFHTRSGVLEARRADGGRIEIDLPALIAIAERVPQPVLAALGLDDSDVEYSARHPNDYRLIVVDAAAKVRALRPDFGALRTRSDTYIVTALSDDPRFEFVSRYFAPSHGIDEDPVTGSAHCILAPYWSERLSRSIVTGHQVSARTGIVECEPRGERVLLRGHAVTTLRGTLC